MPSQIVVLRLVRKILFYLSASSLALILFSFTFSTAGASRESLAIYDQSFLPMPQIALNLILLALSLLHITYALYFSSSSPSPSSSSSSLIRPTSDGRDSGSGMTSFLQFLSKYKYARHIRMAIGLVLAILLMMVSCYGYLIMLVTGNPSSIYSTMVILPTTQAATSTSSICRVVDPQGRLSTGPCLVQMIVSTLEGIASLVLMFEGTSSFALHGKEGMAPPTLRSQDSFERELELHQVARAGALCSTTGGQRGLELETDNVEDYGGVATEHSLFHGGEDIQQEARNQESHRAQDIYCMPNQNIYPWQNADMDRLQDGMDTARVHALAPTVTRPMPRARPRPCGIRPLPPSPHCWSQSQALKNRYQAQGDHLPMLQCLSSRDSMTRGPADPRSPIYDSQQASLNNRRRSVSTMADAASLHSYPSSQMRMGSSLLQHLVDLPTFSRSGSSSQQDLQERERNYL